MAEGSDAITGKFDFYDILGYLVPGLLFIGLLSLPFGLIEGRWPSSSITSAVLYLVSAHILGHILQGFLRAWEKVPQIRDKNGKLRPPSSVLLDADQSLARFRTKIGELVNRLWQIPPTDLLANDHDYDRDAAFLQARNLLLQSKKQSYFEQFQGKYALLGGVTASLVCASAYYAGWAVALIGSDSIVQWSKCAPYVLGGVLAVLLVCLALNHRFESKVFVQLLLPLLLVGIFMGGFLCASASQVSGKAGEVTKTQKEVPSGCAVCCVGGSEDSNESKASAAFPIEHKATFMLILALAAFGAAIRCYSGYKTFAKEFAMGVWRDFANFDLITKNEK